MTLNSFFQTSQKEFNNLTSTLESERYRAEGLEEQINDLTELHQVRRPFWHTAHQNTHIHVHVFYSLINVLLLQNEIENLKQAIADMEEKVQYQSDERLRDVNEVLENCQTRVSSINHTHAHIHKLKNNHISLHLRRYRKWSICRSNNMSPSRALITQMPALWL